MEIEFENIEWTYDLQICGVKWKIHGDLVFNTKYETIMTYEHLLEVQRQFNLLSNEDKLNMEIFLYTLCRRYRNGISTGSAGYLFQISMEQLQTLFDSKSVDVDLAALNIKTCAYIAS